MKIICLETLSCLFLKYYLPLMYSNGVALTKSMIQYSQKQVIEFYNKGYKSSFSCILSFINSHIDNF